MKYLTTFLPGYLEAIVYMLQASEYRLLDYFSWLSRVKDFRTVMYRRDLTLTKKARILLLLLRLTQVVGYGTALYLFYFGYFNSASWTYSVALIIIVLLPLLLAYGVALPLFLGWLFIQKPTEQLMYAKARKIFAGTSAEKIAVVGSHGKTTAKEMLKTVLSEKYRVDATPGNMNTDIGISRFASKLDGSEEILIIEMGEERPGDIRRLSRLVRPNAAIVTGISEAHLSSFKTVDNIVETIFEIDDFVDSNELYKNNENAWIKKHRSDGIGYDSHGVDGWKISNQYTAIDGTSFMMNRDGKVIEISLPLVGLHIIPVAAAVAAIALRRGLSIEQLKEGFYKVEPFEHRMQPRPVHGAWVIDDTYNGNSEGVKAGLDFLKNADAKRRVYVTPGLVEQGEQTEKIHKQIGRQIAESADRVYLMRNSVTDYIVAGLNAKKFGGELLIIDDPLEFYQNLDNFVAAGDVVLMQNDWTDNYQ